MSKSMNVYGGCYDGRNRVIVAATSKKEAYKAVSSSAGYGFLSYYGWNEYSSDTGNEEELGVALSSPGTAFTASVNGGGFVALGKVK